MIIRIVTDTDSTSSSWMYNRALGDFPPFSNNPSQMLKTLSSYYLNNKATLKQLKSFLERFAQLVIVKCVLERCRQCYHPQFQAGSGSEDWNFSIARLTWELECALKGQEQHLRALSFWDDEGRQRERC